MNPLRKAQRRAAGPSGVWYHGWCLAPRPLVNGCDSFVLERESIVDFQAYVLFGDTAEGQSAVAQPSPVVSVHVRVMLAFAAVVRSLIASLTVMVRPATSVTR